MHIFLTIEFALGLLIGIALRASSAERTQLQLWQSLFSAPLTEIGSSMLSPRPNHRLRSPSGVANDPVTERAPYGAFELKSLPCSTVVPLLTAATAPDEASKIRH